MKDTTLPLVVVRMDTIPALAIQPLLDELDKANSPATLIEEPEPGPYACAEWYVPTAVVLFIAKPYFETILKKAAEDHYPHIKRAVGSIWKNFFGEAPLVPRRTTLSSSSSPLKTNLDSEFSLTFSIFAQGGDRDRFKLLLPNAWSKHELERATEIFLNFVGAYHAGEITPEDLRQLREAALGNMVALTVDQDTGRIVFLNPRPTASFATKLD